MTKKNIIQIIVATFVLALAVTPGFSTEQSSMGNMDGSHHDGIDSGRDFGQHVKEMNDHFSGTHNPGRHHKGYSGIKDR